MLDNLKEQEVSKSMTKEAIVDQTSALLSKSIPSTHAAKIQM